MKHFCQLSLLSILLFYSPNKYGATLKGMHDTIGGVQSYGSENLAKLSGKFPEVISSDFGYSTHPNDDFRKRDELLKKYIKLASTTKILTLSYHQCRPDIKEPCTFNTGVANVDLTEKEWKELLTLNSERNKEWQKQLGPLVAFIQALQEKKITLYLRPYHESNIPNFWWADVKKPTNSIALWKMLHQYLTIEQKLKNIIWVWSISFHPKYIGQLKNFYPGDEWVDILGVDIYPPTKNTSPDFSQAWDLLNALSKKPKALTEISKLPGPSELAKHPWLYVVPWGENMLRKENTSEEIKSFYK